MAIKKTKSSTGGKKKSASGQEASAAAAIERSLDGIAQAGVLVAWADGELEESEIGVLAEILHATLAEMGVELTEEVFGAKIEAIIEQFTDKEVPQILGLIAANLTDREAAEAALTVAAVVMVSDGEFDVEGEAPIYLALGEALGFTQEESMAILEEIADGADEDEALGAAPRSCWRGE